ncbi:MAG TPA: ATP synthase subunit I [Terriglobia bacterium]|nr:ATP synthase subunit I [Terriglobia bacterium]
MPEAGKSLFDTAAQRLPRWMMAAAAAGVLGAFASGHGRAAAGFAVGSAAAILAYWWLQRALEGALSSGQPRLPQGTVLKLAARYPLLLGVVALFYRTGWLPSRAVMAGLFVPLVGVLIESVVLMPEALRRPASMGKYGPPPAQIHS